MRARERLLLHRVRARPTPAARTLVLDDLRHARVDVDDPPPLDFAYARWFAAATADLGTDRRGLDALHVGGGGFTFPRYLLARPRGAGTPSSSWTR